MTLELILEMVFILEYNKPLKQCVFFAKSFCHKLYINIKRRQILTHSFGRNEIVYIYIILIYIEDVNLYSLNPQRSSQTINRKII